MEEFKNKGNYRHPRYTPKEFSKFCHHRVEGGSRRRLAATISSHFLPQLALVVFFVR